MQPLVLRSALVILLTSSVNARAQRPGVQLCLQRTPESARRAVRFELETRGFDVREDTCRGDAVAAAAETGALWVVGLDPDSPLADLWIWAARTHTPNDRRRVRVDGPLDTVNRRALAIAIASLLEEETPEGLDPVAPPTPEPTEFEGSPEHLDQSVPTQPHEVLTEAHEIPVVRSSRNLMLRHVLAVGLTGAQLTGDEYGGGALLLYGLHLSPQFRMDFSADGVVGRRFSLGVMFGFTYVFELARRRRWLELGGALRYELRSERKADERAFMAVGAVAMVAFQQRIYRGLRFYVRGDGGPLLRLDGNEQELHSSVRLTAGILVRR